MTILRSKTPEYESRVRAILDGKRSGLTAVEIATRLDMAPNVVSWVLDNCTESAAPVPIERPHRQSDSSQHDVPDHGASASGVHDGVLGGVPDIEASASPSATRDRRSSWSDEAIALLRKLWPQGLSAAQIARSINVELRIGLSRNSVIGKATRLGLPTRSPARPIRGSATQGQRKFAFGSSTSAKPSAPRPSTGEIATRIKRPPGPTAPGSAPLPTDSVLDRMDQISDVPMEDRVALVDLDAASCRWPIGDPSRPFPEFGFCPAKHAPGLPYCERHARLAFQPPQPRRRGSPARRTEAVEFHVKHECRAGEHNKHENSTGGPTEPVS